MNTSDTEKLIRRASLGTAVMGVPAMARRLEAEGIDPEVAFLAAHAGDVLARLQEQDQLDWD